MKPRTQLPGTVLCGPEGPDPAWMTVNDAVMGGVSQSRMEKTNSNTLLFSGLLSLENNGGFASTRTVAQPWQLEATEGLLMRVRGCGRRYQLRVQANGANAGVFHAHTFASQVSQWLDCYVPYTDMAPRRRGANLPLEPVDPRQIHSLGFLCGDKQAGEFSLEVAWVTATSQHDADAWLNA